MKHLIIILLCGALTPHAIHAGEPPKMSPEVINGLKKHAVDDSLLKVETSKPAPELNPVSILDQILGQEELRALRVTSVAQLPKDLLEELIASVINEGPPPELISLKRKILEANDRAITAPLRLVKGISISDSLSVEPGSSSIKLRLMKDMDTTIEFYDQAGNPWPVINQRVANDSFGITRPEVATHILYVRPSRDFTVTNLSVILDSVNTSFAFMLSTNEHQISTTEAEFDERIRYTVPMVSRAMKESYEKNPAASRSISPIDDAVGYFLDQTHFDFLDDVVVIPVLDGAATAYLYKGSLYIRTKYDSFVYPGSVASSRPENSYRVYKSKSVEPILTFYHDGKRQFIILDDDVLHTAHQQFERGSSKTGAYSAR